ncbi:von Willebrand factor D and EGF domain-containing [Paramuricea clavata]|uniref:von Willebrand factor D and EGF domain-containing n=1 Tax=Paramuricea clavata TaxID=317549 RepID=A0A6S7IJU5_PARCT|nr:von Willebrand factor D and EGF domain-containing [Paramuricea clavata]
MAVDPENQDMTFTLLSNGTLITARISKQLLTITNLKENGTVYVQVQDEMDGKNILILQVNAFECPCVHNGKCYQSKSIAYPVHPTDYFCQCEDPYTGDRCEIRSNPCDELPCYPGLECSTAQNSEGFTCEKCPTLFQGDGKQCELKPTEEKSSVASEMTLTDQKWDDQLKTKTSDVYKNLVSLLTIEIRNVYKNRAAFSYVIIKGFRRGSIIVEFDLIFTTKKVEDPLKPLMEVVETGKLGNMTVKMKTIPDETKDDSSEDKILGLDKTIFFVIVGAAVVFILMISVAIYLRIKRHRTHREANLRTRILNTSDKKAQGIAFRPAGQGSDEEMDLEVLDNEPLHLDEEIKIQP